MDTPSPCLLIAFTAPSLIFTPIITEPRRPSLTLEDPRERSLARVDTVKAVKRTLFQSLINQEQVGLDYEMAF